MAGQAGSPIRWGRWSVAWGVLFAGTLLWLPRGATHRVELKELLVQHEFADDRTLIACSQFRVEEWMYPRKGPLAVLDVPTGTIRWIDLPGDPFQGITQVESERQWRAMCQSGWSLAWFQPVRDFVVVVMARGEHQNRLHVWNWRTGEEVLRRDISGQNVGVTGDRVWLRPQRPVSASATVSLLEIPSGRVIPTGLPAEGLDLGHGPRSPDGRFLVETGAEAVRVWRIDPGVVEFTCAGAKLAAFSDDSRWLATLTELSPESARPKVPRTWRIYEVATGRLVAESVQDVHGSATESLAFHAGDESVFAYADAIAFKSGPPCRSSFSWIETWRWKTGEHERRQPSNWKFRDADDRPVYPGLTTPRLVTDEQTLVDVVTGAKLGTFPERVQTDSIAPSRRWATVMDDSPQFRDRVANVIQKFWYSLGSWFESDRQLMLYDLETVRPAARLATYERGCRFTPDSRWLVVQHDDKLEIWSLPPALPWRNALLVSLLVPGLFAIRHRLAGRRPKVASHETQGAAPDGTASL